MKTGNTKVDTVNGLTVVRLYSTDIVMFNKDRITLNTGGYYSNTTKDRMNAASQDFSLGYKVFQKNRVWGVDYKGKTHLFGTDNKVTLERG